MKNMKHVEITQEDVQIAIRADSVSILVFLLSFLTDSQTEKNMKEEKNETTLGKMRNKIASR